MKASLRNGQAGFTLIELLVVCLIIAILAAVAIPAMTGQRNRSYDASAKVAVRTAQTTMETWFTDHRDYEATVADLVEIEPALQDRPSDTLVITPGAAAYSLTITSVSGNTFSLSHSPVGTERTCTRVTNGSCPNSGSW